jgi:hypothetical protein
MHPAGSKIIAGMLAKGWIEKQPDGRTYCISSRQVIPVKRLTRLELLELA